MNMTHVIATLLLCAFLLGALLRIIGVFRLPQAMRPTLLRTTLLLLLSALSCALLYGLLAPRFTADHVDTLIVMTEGASPTAPATDTAHALVIRLPGAPEDAQAERVPDLATALRMHPQTQTLHVIGHGLESRDRAAIGTRTLSFQPAKLPAGFRAIGQPAPVLAGQTVRVGGEASALQEGIVELRDPAGQVVARSPLPANGQFVLEARTFAAGPALFELRLRDGDRVVDRQPIPVLVTSQQAARVALLAGGPAPDVKYLRRWAADHGASLHSDVMLGGGMQVGDGTLALNASTLSKFDMLIVDERRWDGMGDTGRGALLSAARGGLGVLIRITGPMSSAGRSSLRNAGISLTNASLPATATLSNALGQDRAGPALARMPLQLAASEGNIWLRDARNEPLAAWSSFGRGRVGAWLPMDTFQIALAGDENTFDAMWSDAFVEMARATQRVPQMDTPSGIIGMRSSLCGLAKFASIIAPDNSTTTLELDPATSGCAAFWPSQAGWHVVESEAKSRHWYVHDLDSSRTLQLSLRQAETAALVNQTPRSTRGSSAISATRLSNAWLWFAWLIVTSMLWLIERSRWGRRAS